MTWEYRVEKLSNISFEPPGEYVSDSHPEKLLGDLLNELGMVGWELVGIVPFVYGGDTEGVTLLFKRMGG